MSYTVYSSFLSPPIHSPDAWITILQAHGAADAEEIVNIYFRDAPLLGLNPDLALAQACLECAYFTDWKWTQNRNPAGMGSTSREAMGGIFNTIQEGIRAHLEHLVDYTMAADPPLLAEWGMLDQRHGFFKNMPAVRDLETPPFKWAIPGDNYAVDIVNVANSVPGEAPAPGGNMEPTEQDIGFPVEIDLTTSFPNAPKRALSDIRWWINHDTEGGEPGSEVILEGHSASVTALIDRDGAFELIVPVDTTPWTAGNDFVSELAIQIEFVGFRSSGYADEQYQSCANFYKFCVARGMNNVPLVHIPRASADGIYPDANGFLGHEDVPNPNTPGAWGGSGGHTDPGPLFDWDKFLSLCGGAAQVQDGYRTFTETGHGMGGGIRKWWEGTNDALTVLGFPVTEEFQYGGRTTQCFQRCVVQWFPENKGTKYEFQTMLLGSFFARDLGFSGPGIPQSAIMPLKKEVIH